MLHSYTKHIISLFVAALFIASCGEVEVELCNAETHPHLAPINVEFVWGESNESFNHEIPDSMYVLSYRIIDSWKSGYVSTTKPTDNKGRYVFNNPMDEVLANENAGNDTADDGATDGTDDGNVDNGATDGTDDTTTDGSGAAGGNTANGNTGENNNTAGENNGPTDSSAPFNLKRGDYRFIALNYSEDDATFEYIGFDPEAVDEAIPAKELVIKYRSYKLYDAAIDKFGNDWTDFNRYSEYVQSNVNSVYYYYTDIYEILPNRTNTIQLHPQSITQDIEIRFSVERQSVEIEKIMGEISGIAQSLNVYTGEADASRTFKMLMQPVEISKTETSEMSGMNEYSAKFSVTALVRNESPDYITGAGIMQLAIYTHTMADDGSKKEKVINVGINLFNTMEEYGRIIYGYDEPILLNIKNVLTISKDKVLEKTESSDNLDYWINYEDIDIDL